ncbi:MAG: DUF2298 domain-containing protein, partial [Halobacteriaceae archaeon]
MAATGKDRVGQVLIQEGDFSYWFASRVIPNAITEFPLFAYLNGDLHGHMMVVPITLLGFAICLGYYRTPAGATMRRRLLLFGALPPVVGFILFTNTWSFPTILGIAWLTLVFSPTPPITLLLPGRDTSDNVVLNELRRITVSALLVLPIATIGIAWVAPFVPNVLLSTASNRSIGFLPERTNIVALVVAHGTFLVPFAGYIIGSVAWEEHQERVLGALVSVFALITLTTIAGAAAVGVVGPVLVMGWYLHRRGTLGAEAIPIVAGCGLVLLVEFVYLKDGAASGRFNTVFKVYAQVWALWSIPFGVALAALLRPRSTERYWDSLARSFGVSIWLVIAALYGLLSLVQHFEPFVRTWYGALIEGHRHLLSLQLGAAVGAV